MPGQRGNQHALPLCRVQREALATAAGAQVTAIDAGAVAAVDVVDDHRATYASRTATDRIDPDAPDFAIQPGQHAGRTAQVHFAVIDLGLARGFNQVDRHRRTHAGVAATGGQVEGQRPDARAQTGLCGANAQVIRQHLGIAQVCQGGVGNPVEGHGPAHGDIAGGHGR